MLNFSSLNKKISFVFLFAVTVLVNSQEVGATDLVDNTSKRLQKQNFAATLEKATSEKDPVKAVKLYFHALSLAPQNWQTLLASMDPKDDYAVGATFYYIHKFVNHLPSENMIALLLPQYDRDDTVEMILDKLGAAADDGDVRALSKLSRFLRRVDNPNPVSVKVGIERGRKAFRHGKVNIVPTIVELLKLQTSFFGMSHELTTYAPYDTPLQIPYEPEKDPEHIVAHCFLPLKKIQRWLKVRKKPYPNQKG